MSSIFTLLGQKVKAHVSTEISSLENGQVATNTSNISTNTSDIATNASDIATNASDISTNQSNISTNASAIDTVEASAGLGSDGSYSANSSTNYLGSVATLKAADEALDTQVKTNADNITSNDSDISSLQSDMSTAQSDIVSNDSDISSLQSDMSTAQSDITSNDSDISDLQTQAGSIAADGNSANFSGNLQAADLTLSGNLTVQGTTTSVETTNLDVQDSILNLSKGTGDGDTASNDVGFVVERGSTENNVAFVWDEGNDRFTAYESSSAGAFTASDTDLDSTDGSAGFATAQFADVYVNNGGTATNLGTVAEFESALS